MEFMTKQPIADVETQVENVLDNVVWTPTTKKILIRTIDKYYDAEGKMLRSKAGKEILKRDEPANEETGKEVITDYTDFLIAAGIDMVKVVTAIKNLE